MPRPRPRLVSHRPTRTVPTRAGAVRPVAVVDDRRSAPRFQPSTLPPLEVRLADGTAIDIVNISRTGLLARSRARLLPGAMIGLRIVAGQTTVMLMGRVVRASLVALDDEHPCYESALVFSQEFPLLAFDAHAATDAQPGAVPRAATEPSGPYPVEIGRLNGSPTVLTVTARPRKARASAR